MKLILSDNKANLIFLVIWLVLILALPTYTHAQTITTVVGGNPSANGGPATEYSLSYPEAVAVDGNGNYYITDVGHEQILKITSAGIVTIIAGNGTQGYNGDGILATSASLFVPYGVTADNLGNVYIADTRNNRVRRVDPSGIITTVAGTGVQGYSGDGGAATAAQLNNPYSVVIDKSGNLYIADNGNNRIRKVDPTGIITTVAGNGIAGYGGDGALATNAQLYGPRAITLDGSSNLYIADYNNGRIRKVRPTGIIITIAGNPCYKCSNGDGGPAAAAKVESPTGVAVDVAGNVYISQAPFASVRKIDTDGIITTAVGTYSSGFSGDGGPATAAKLNYPSGLAIDAKNNLLIVDNQNNRIRQVNSANSINTIAGTSNPNFGGDGRPATLARLFKPTSVAVDGNGTIYIADTGNDRIRQVDSTGIITSLSGSGYGITVDAGGNIYMAVPDSHVIRKRTPEGLITTVAGTGVQGYSGDGGAATAAQLKYPSSVAVDKLGNLYIADVSNNRIRKVDPTGVITTVAGNGVLGSGEDGTVATAFSLYRPQGIAIDTYGNLYIADTGNQRVRKVNPDGIVTTVAGNGSVGSAGDGGSATSAQLNNPVSIIIEGDSNLYIVDSANQRIRKINSSGIVTTIAGNGNAGFSGDGGIAINAELNNPSGIALDKNGNFYIADVSNDRIRKVSATPPTSLSFDPVNTTAVCSASVFSLTATATNFTPNSYKWVSTPAGMTASGANPTFSAPTVTFPSNYTFTLTASDGSRTLTASHSLVVLPPPTIKIASSGSLSCDQVSVTLIATTGLSSYSFSQGASQSGSSASNYARISAAGTYTVTASNEIGCQASASITVDYYNCPPKQTAFVSPQSTTVNQPFNFTIPTSLFTDAETSANISLVVRGLPNGLTFTAPATISGTVSSTTGSPFSVTIIATDPEGLSNHTTFQLAVKNSFSIIGVALVNCVEDGPTRRTIRFNPDYSGLNGQPVSFSVENELPSTINSGPYQLTIYTDNPTIIIKATQHGSSTEASFNYNWLAACSNTSCTSMFSVKAGRWEDASIWSCGRVPLITDPVKINHTVSLPDSYRGQAVRVTYSETGRLVFAISSRLKLQSN